jgi:hypothetical protein
MRRWALCGVATLGLLLGAGCKDRCEGEAPAFALEIVLPAGVDGAKVTALAITTDVASLHQAQTIPISDQLADGRTTIAVDVGAAGASGFVAEVSVDARDAAGHKLAWGHGLYGGSGDACNLFQIVLKGLATDAAVEGRRDCGMADRVGQ